MGAQQAPADSFFCLVLIFLVDLRQGHSRMRFHWICKAAVTHLTAQEGFSNSFPAAACPRVTDTLGMCAGRRRASSRSAAGWASLAELLTWAFIGSTCLARCC